MNQVKKIFLILIGVMIMVVALGCTNEETKEVKEEQEVKQENGVASDSDDAIKKESYKDTIVYGLWSAPDGFFNPALSNTDYDSAVTAIVYDSLIKYDKDMNIVVSMASSYEISEDEKTIQFKLRENIKWHDGQVLTPDDVVFTLESLADGKYTGSYATIVEGIEGYEDYNTGKTDHLTGIEVEGQKISIHLKEVYAPALMNIGQFGILPKHIWSQVPVAEWQEASDLLHKPVGSGPYKLVEIEEGHHLKFEANENYFGTQVATQNFVFKITNRDNVQIQIENGEVDIANISDMKAKDIEAMESLGIKTTSFANHLIQYMGFNLRDQRFKDNRVRAAFMHAIDRQLMVDTLVGGKGQLINTPMTPTGWAYPPADSLNPYGYDVEKSKSLLKEAGWSDKDNNNILEDEFGNEFKIVLTYPSGDKLREESAPIIQNYLKAVGIDVTLEMLEFKATMAKVVGDHEFDVYLMGNSLDADPDPKPYWHSTAASDEKGVYGWNIAGFKNEEADALMMAGLNTTNQDKRKKIYNEFGVLMNKELPWITLYSKDVIMAHNPNLENYNPSTYTKFVDIEKWKIKE